jgi:uncharacterized phiE125 gp8 family phage protein
MAIVIVTPPTDLPVTLAEAKMQLRVDTTDHDAMISGQIAAATAMLESWLGRALAEQTLELVLDCFPADEVILPRGPVQSVESVIYIDVDEVEQTIDPEDYRVDLSNDQYGRVYPVDAWPVAFDATGTVRFRYVTGYPLADEDVATTPWPIKVAIMMLTAHWYANAEAVSAGSMLPIPLGVQDLVAPYRVVSV